MEQRERRHAFEVLETPWCFSWSQLQFSWPAPLRAKNASSLPHDFSSADGEHGYGVDLAQWTPDSLFFVCLMSNSGGHSPLYRPVVFWSRKTNRFYGLDAYTGDVVFSIIATDKVRVKTWPGLEPAIVSLSRIMQGQATEFR